MASPDLLAQVDALLASRPDLVEDPYPLYHRLQAEAPVLIHRNVVMVTRYRDIEAICRDQRTFASSRGAGGTRERAAFARLNDHDQVLLREAMAFIDHFLIMQDPPGHVRLRSMIHRVFTPKRVAGLRGRIAALANEILDEVAAAATHGVIDFAHDVAEWFPLRVIAEMLGAHRSDLPKVRAAVGRVLLHGDPAEDVRAVHAAQGEFRAYIRGLVAERRETTHSDLLAALLDVDIEGDRLTGDELEATFVFLLLAGHETTTSLLANGLLALFTNADQIALLRREPDRVPDAVEEMLRYDAPFEPFHRRALEDTVIGGVPIAKDSTVLLYVGAANRDPDAFTDPDRFDIRRTDQRHLAFGIGAHFCLGNVLARTEAQVMLDAFLRRWPRAEIDGRPIRSTNNRRNLASLRFALE